MGIRSGLTCECGCSRHWTLRDSNLLVKILVPLIFGQLLVHLGFAGQEAVVIWRLSFMNVLCCESRPKLCASCLSITYRVTARISCIFTIHWVLRYHGPRGLIKSDVPQQLAEKPSHGWISCLAQRVIHQADLGIMTFVLLTHIITDSRE